MLAGLFLWLAVLVMVAPAAGQDWRQFRHDAKNTGHQAADVDGATWTHRTSGPVPEPVVPSGVGTVYVDGEGLHVLDPATGDERWRFSHDLSTRPTVADGTVLAGTGAGRLYARNPDNSLRWQFSADEGGAIHRAPAVAGDTVVLTAGEMLHGLSLRTGDARWSTELRSALTSAATVEGDVYLSAYSETSDESTVYGIDAEVGTILWRYERPGRLGMPVAGQGRLYVAAGDGSLVSLARDTGRQLWRRDAPVTARTSPAYLDGQLVLTTPGGDVVALDATTGAVDWRRSLDGLPSTTPAVGDGVIHAATAEGLVALDRADGRPIWRAALEAAPLGSPTVAGDTVYVGTQRGVEAVDRADGGPAASTTVDGRSGEPDGSGRDDAAAADVQDASGPTDGASGQTEGTAASGGETEADDDGGPDAGSDGGGDSDHEVVAESPAGESSSNGTGSSGGADGGGGGSDPDYAVLFPVVAGLSAMLALAAGHGIRTWRS